MEVNNLYNSTEIASHIKQRARVLSVQIGDMLKDIGLNNNTLSGMNHGKALSSASLAKIADYLDCSVDYLLGRTVDAAVKADEQTARLVNAYADADEAIKIAVNKLLGIE